MYWLISILIIVVMMGVLTVAGEVSLPSHLLVANTDSSLFWPFLLFGISFILFIYNQRRALSFAVLFNANASIAASSIARLSSEFIKISRPFIVMVLGLCLIVGSMLQALYSHQHLESTKITQTSRVQAWVTIEGISDSIYDVATESGYRQVATLSDIQPLIAEESVTDLDKQAQAYLVDNPNELLNKSRLMDKEGQHTLSPRVLLSLYPKKSSETQSMSRLNDLQPGDKLLMTLTLAPLASSEQTLNNPSGFDSYRWLRARHIDGVANIIAVSSIVDDSGDVWRSQRESQSYWQRWRQTIDTWRWQLRQHLYQGWGSKTTAEQQAVAVTLSLLTGDRSLISRDSKDLYQRAGISHLLAISGTHVLFLAIILAAIATLLAQRFYPALYRTLPRWQLRWWVMIASAFIYALFTGFDVPAARTAWMLLAIGLLRLTLLPINPMRVLLALAVIMAWFDPYILWQAGYWLSFIAVALLLNYDDGLQEQTSTFATTEIIASSSKASQKGAFVIDSSNNTRFEKAGTKKLIADKKLWLAFKRLVKLQCWLFIALLPITLLLFGKASLWGLVINLFAIGLFGWVIVPLDLLAGICYLFAPSIADSIWTVVSVLVNYLHEIIGGLTDLPMLKEAWLYTPISIAMLLIAALAILPWLLPRGLLSRLLALPPLTLFLMTLYNNQHAFSLEPTLYILPTADRYLSAAVLAYPSDNSTTNQANNSKPSINKKQIHWLFLADHRQQGERTMPSALDAEKLATTIEQQLRTLSIKALDGVIVQNGTLAMTDTLSNPTITKTKKTAVQASNLLPLTVATLNQTLPINQYWQAGRHERWPKIQQAQRQTSHPAIISAQDCNQNKSWQSSDESLMLQALTGWSEIAEASVWDCSIAITSDLPIAVRYYNAASPDQPLAAKAQIIASDKRSISENSKPSSRLIIDAATHAHNWQLWSLLCEAEPFAIDIASYSTATWLGHSNSMISLAALEKQKVAKVLTYDDESLEIALGLSDNP